MDLESDRPSTLEYPADAVKEAETYNPRIQLGHRSPAELEEANAEAVTDNVEQETFDNNLGGLPEMAAAELTGAICQSCGHGEMSATHCNICFIRPGANRAMRVKEEVKEEVPDWAGEEEETSTVE